MSATNVASTLRTRKPAQQSGSSRNLNLHSHFEDSSDAPVSEMDHVLGNNWGTLIDQTDLSYRSDTFNFYDNEINSSLPEVDHPFATDFEQIQNLVPEPSLTEEWTGSGFEIISANDLSRSAQSIYEKSSTV